LLLGGENDFILLLAIKLEFTSTLLLYCILIDDVFLFDKCRTTKICGEQCAKQKRDSQQIVVGDITTLSTKTKHKLDALAVALNRHVLELVIPSS